LTKSSEDQPESVNLSSRKDLIRRLNRDQDARTKFVDSHINKTLAFQIRSLRGELTQEKAMEKLGMNQNAISRLENPYYGKATLTTLKRIASAYDIGLLVEFVPFSRLVDRVSGTPHTDNGLSPSTMNVPSFEKEVAQGVLDELVETNGAIQSNTSAKLVTSESETQNRVGLEVVNALGMPTVDTTILDVSVPVAASGSQVPPVQMENIESQYQYRGAITGFGEQKPVGNTPHIRRPVRSQGTVLRFPRQRKRERAHA